MKSSSRAKQLDTGHRKVVVQIQRTDRGTWIFRINLCQFCDFYELILLIIKAN